MRHIAAGLDPQAGGDHRRLAPVLIALHMLRMIQLIELANRSRTG